MRPCGSNCRDPENRSRKSCCCGGHQGKRGRKPRKRWSRRFATEAEHIADDCDRNASEAEQATREANERGLPDADAATDDCDSLAAWGTYGRALVAALPTINDEADAELERHLNRRERKVRPLKRRIR